MSCGRSAMACGRLASRLAGGYNKPRGTPAPVVTPASSPAPAAVSTAPHTLRRASRQQHRCYKYYSPRSRFGTSPTQNSTTTPVDTPTRTTTMSSAAEATKAHEALLKRNPHGNFKAVEASRPPFDAAASLRYTQTPQPGWKQGGGANQLQAVAPADHITIAPYEEGRAAHLNYKLLISAIIPRPIAFVSTVGKDGSGEENLAPFSYFNMINHDPPLFVVGFASPAEGAAAKDTVRHLSETGECVINIISEGYVEAANAASVNAPGDASEWLVSGLTPARDTVDVRPPRVKEAIFSIEGKVESLREFKSKAVAGKTSGTMAVIEGVRFWARGDAISEARDMIDPAVLRPISRLGGITYGRSTEAFELPRPDFEKDVGGQEGMAKLKDVAAAKT
ncbi:hypothetical protein RB598_005065 [Gaeumannomyces tritici]